MKALGLEGIVSRGELLEREVAGGVCDGVQESHSAQRDLGSFDRLSCQGIYNRSFNGALAGGHLRRLHWAGDYLRAHSLRE